MTNPSETYESPYTTEIGRRIRDDVRALVPLIRAHAVQGEALGALPPETVQALQRTGLFLVSVPLEHGGYALGARDLVEIVTEVARGDGSAGWITMIASGFARVLLTFDDSTVGEVYRSAATWLGPVAAGASLFSEKIQRGRRVEGGYIVNRGGKWAFGSGCKHAAYVCVGIEYEGANGEKHRGMALLERGKYEIVDDWKVMGLSGSSSNSVTTTEDVFVPENRFVDLARFPERLDSIRTRYRGLGFNLDALGLMLIVALETMTITLGMALGTLECFIEQAKARKPFNLPYRTVGEMPSVQVVVAKAQAAINAARALLYAQADAIDRKALHGQRFTPAEESMAIMDMVYAGNLCGDAIDKLQIALGSSTVSLHNPIQRFARDVRVALTHGSTRLDPVAEICGRHVMGLPPLSAFTAALPGVPGATATASPGTRA